MLTLSIEPSSLPQNPYQVDWTLSFEGNILTQGTSLDSSSAYEDAEEWAFDKFPVGPIEGDE